MVLWGKCTFREFHLSHVTKTHESATMGTCLALSGKCAKSALKQSDSVASSNVQGTGRCTGLSRETAAQTLIPTHCIYKALRIRFKGHTSSLITASSVWSEYRIFG